MFLTTTVGSVRYLTSIWVIVLLIFTILIGGILPHVERKFLALVQRRIGPDIVGYRGRLQPIADALKLFGKESIIIDKVNKLKALLSPTAYLLLNIGIFTFISWTRDRASILQFEYSMPILLAVLNFGNMIVSFLGSVLKNKYIQIASNRALNIAINFDVVITLLLVYTVSRLRSFNLNHLQILQGDYPGALFLMPAVPCLFYMYLMDVGRAPFDLVESESEVVMGYHSEYSSFLFAIFVLGEYIHMGVFSYIFGMYTAAIN